MSSAVEKRKLEEVLTKAVRELAKATVETAKQIPVDTLEELRLITKSVNILSSKSDVLITKAQESTTQHAAILQQITTLTAAVTKSRKVPTLQWAINNVNLGMFAFYVDKDRNTNRPTNSDAIVREILMAFIQGFGRGIEGFVYTQAQINSYHQVTAEEIVTARTAFHSALITQIHSLTGAKPRIAPQASDPTKFAIYYEKR